MYKDYFGFKFSPFSIAPDPHYLYMSDQHREALAHLLYGIKNDGGFVLLTGEVGTGKTTVCRCLLEQLPENTDIAIVLNPKLNAQELLATICEEFGIKTEKGSDSIKFLIDHLNRYLLDAHAHGRRCILIIDEAQNLSTEVLEQLRLLTNLETNERKLLQIIMIGQPELKELLENPELRQLAQRVTARYHLNPLSEKEVRSYISHRLNVAGTPRHLCRQLFAPAILNKIYDLSQGVPRIINVICDRALLGAYVQGLDKVDKKTIRQAGKEVFGTTDGQSPGTFTINSAWVFATLVLVLCLTLGVFYYLNLSGTADQLRADEAAAVTPDKVVPPRLELPEQIQPDAELPQATVIPETSAIPPLETVSLNWPEDIPLSQSKTLAYETLFKAWGLAFDPARLETPCQTALEVNLKCMHLKGSLDSLIHLNRPAVLTLYTDAGEEYFAALVSIQGQAAQFSIAGKTYLVQQSEIWARWYGDYTLLWSMPPGYQESLRPGDKGPAVEWLAQRFAEIGSRAPEKKAGTTYDSDLVEEVKKFQFAKHLVPDGVLGPQTVIHLNNEGRTKVPKLIQSGGTR